MEPYRPNCYKIPELNGLRVLLVFIVSWYHFWQQSWLTPSIGSYSLDYLLRAGYMPVDGTILLSGFLLFLPYARAMLLGEAVPNTKQFYQRRIMRIVPSYYFVTLALLFAVALPWHLYYNSSDMVRDVVMHLTFTQTFNPATYIATPIGVASWTIAIEMQAYLIFPLLGLAVAGILLTLPFAARPLRFLMGNRVMGWLAAVSMNYYLLHQNLAVHLKRLGVPPSVSAEPNRAGEQPWQLQYTLLCFGLSLLGAALITLLIEKPCAKVLKKMFARGKAENKA